MFVKANTEIEITLSLKQAQQLYTLARDGGHILIEHENEPPTAIRDDIKETLAKLTTKLSDIL